MIAVTMPAYNEAAGIEEFLLAIDSAFGDTELTLVVVDDVSTDTTVQVVRALAGELRAAVAVERNETNSGHGPTCLHAYRAALATGSDVVVHVDGDGQFSGTDIRRVADAVGRPGVGVAYGVRANRVDPWYRKVLTRIVGFWVGAVFGVRGRDVNTPLRAYTRDTLTELLEHVPADSLVPNVYLTALAARTGVGRATVEVTHLDRSDGEQGTMWGSGRSLLVPMSLVRFVGRAGRESLRMRRTLRTLK